MRRTETLLLLMAFCLSVGNATNAEVIVVGSDGEPGDWTLEVPVSSWIRSNEPDTNKPDREIFVGGVDVSSFRGIVGFDLSDVPDDITVTSVSVTLFSHGQEWNSSGDEGDEGNLAEVDLNLLELLQSDVTNAATWFTFDGENEWEEEGGDVGPILTTTSADLDDIFEDDEVVFPSSAGLIGATQAALANDFIAFRVDAPAAEDGEGRNFFVFDGAAENALAGSDLGPSISIEFTVGGGVIGDFNNNGTLDVEDIDALSSEVASGNNNQPFDLTGDGVVNQDDVNAWIKDPTIGNSWIGDANYDKEFSSSDFVQVFQEGKFETGETANWSQGDFNGDGEFNTSDFVVAFQDGGFELGPRSNGVANVPEPSSIWAGLLGIGLGLLRFRERDLPSK